MVHDGVEKNLTKEVEKIKNCQDKMRKMLEKAAIQLKLNRAAQHACECDSGDKHHAQGIDDKCHQLRNTSMGLGYYPGIENVDNTISTQRPGSGSHRRTSRGLRGREPPARD
ncbi:TEKT3 [Bugula neritina]|uniref:Tektin n=1 Tax=Bugula neritina TaxID=10212 RepID=A0A7J7JCL5_BUGNE|nr:TEKT3 [Bugula neritina]